MSPRNYLSAVLASALALSALLAPSAGAAPAPAKQAWNLQALAAPTNFKPGESSGVDLYEAFLTNVGAKASDRSPITITDTLPPGLAVKDVEVTTSRQRFNDLNETGEVCEEDTVATVTTVTCEVKEGLPSEPARVEPGDQILVKILLIIPDGTSNVALSNLVEVEGGGAEPLSAEAHNEIDPECKAVRECAPAGFQEFQSALTGPDGRAVSAAGSHPYQLTSAFAVNLNPSPPGSELPYLPAGGDLKDVEVALPPGLIANPTASDTCTAQQFNTTHGVAVGTLNISQNECPDGSAVGVALVQQLEGKGEIFGHPAIYSLVPPRGMPAQFGFQPILGLPVYIDTAVRQGPEGLRVVGLVRNITEAKRVTAALFVFWGTPSDPSHDPLRGQCALAGGSCTAGIAVKPSFRLPTACENPLLTTFSFLTWTQPAAAASASFEEGPPSACEEPDFSPEIEAKPTTNVADAPSGLHFTLELPQAENEDPNGVGEADLRDATVRLPRGLAVNPAAANGRAACSPAQIGLRSAVGQVPAVFDEAPAACPDAAKVGKVEVDTPLLEHPISGWAYLAQQQQNPFASLLALYITLEDPQTGIVVKLAGKVTPDPLTGQLTTTVTENPQVPFEELRFTFFEGARAPLRTPPTCATYTTTTEMVPWSAPAGQSAAPTGSFAITAGPQGPCPSGALEPKLSAGLANPTAATYSPFSLRLTRPDASAEFASLTSLPPSGLVAKLAGVPYCPEAGIAQAASRSHPGQGALEAGSPSCPAASRVGATSAGAGAGPTPFYASGQVYLAGPYKGAPLSLVAIVPALAGPFDLGVVTVRIALQVNPETAQVSAQSDPLPTILAGIPLDLRDIQVNLDRPNFTLAPTSCDPKSITATVGSPSGAQATLSDRFQLGGCAALGFKPALTLKLSGATKRTGHPALRSVLTYPKGAYANLAAASVALPHSEFLDQTHIGTICTRVQFAANACPKGSIYGKAKATTPLLDGSLSGPVYLRSSSHPLPDLVIALHGQIDVVAVGRIDSKNGGIRANFESVPDAPISKFTLEMQGGKKGLFINSRNICKHPNRANVRFTGQNGKIHESQPLLKADCKGTKAKK